MSGIPTHEELLPKRQVSTELTSLIQDLYFRKGTMKNLRKLAWNSVYTFNDDKSSFNILVPADNTSKTGDSRVTLVKVE